MVCVVYTNLSFSQTEATKIQFCDDALYFTAFEDIRKASSDNPFGRNVIVQYDSSIKTYYIEYENSDYEKEKMQLTFIQDISDDDTKLAIYKDQDGNMINVLDDIENKKFLMLYMVDQINDVKKNLCYVMLNIQRCE